MTARGRCALPVLADMDGSASDCALEEDQVVSVLVDVHCIAAVDANSGVSRLPLG